MSQSVKKLLSVLFLAAVAMPEAKAFSLGGPIDTTWQTPQIGYGLAPEDIVGPMNLGEEYRWNTPTIVYAFDSSFLDYFGQEGVNAVEAAVQVINALPPFSAMSADLSEFPLDTRRFNHRATALGIRDMKSWALSMLLEALGLAAPERWVYSLRALVTDGNGIAGAITIRRNFDPVTLLPSSYVNGTLYTYAIGPISTVPEFDATEVTVDPLAPSVTSVAALAALESLLAGPPGFRTDFRGAGTLINPGLFYTGLTRDDVGGLRYLYRTSNHNVENVSSNAVSALGAGGGNTIGSTVAWLPVPGSQAAGQQQQPGGVGGQQPGGVGQPGGGLGGVGTTTNALVDVALRPGVDKITLIRANFDSIIGATFSNVVVYTDIIITNGVVRQQLARRVLTQPDILFSAADLGLINNINPVLIDRDIAYQNNSTLNSIRPTPLSGPGVINPRVEIAFGKLGPFLQNFPLGGFREEQAIRGLIWGSFDGTTNAPIVFPRGTSIEQLERLLLEKGGGTPWKVVGAP
ncbi:MAG: hypothetical protein FJ403_11745 [Verrucomicrobia bacterium]|nr:hypothetical protein [Verrucomicrobiota bacterium]